MLDIARSVSLVHNLGQGDDAFVHGQMLLTCLNVLELKMLNIEDMDTFHEDVDLEASKTDGNLEAENEGDRCDPDLTIMSLFSNFDLDLP